MSTRAPAFVAVVGVESAPVFVASLGAREGANEACVTRASAGFRLDRARDETTRRRDDETTSTDGELARFVAQRARVARARRAGRDRRETRRDDDGERDEVLGGVSPRARRRVLRVRDAVEGEDGARVRGRRERGDGEEGF